MTDLEKLNTIRARCVELLAIDSLLRLNKASELYEGHGGQLCGDLQSILTAWEGLV